MHVTIPIPMGTLYPSQANITQRLLLKFSAKQKQIARALEILRWDRLGFHYFLGDYLTRVQFFD